MADTSGWNALKNVPEDDIGLMNQFVDGETKLCARMEINKDKAGDISVKQIPTRYPEINTKDLKIGNIDTSLVDIAVNANMRAAQAVKYYAEKTGFDLVDSYNFMLGVSLRRLSLSASKNGFLLREMRGHRLIEEGTQHIYERNMNEPQKKKFLGLF